MDQEPALILRDIRETRRSLGDKLELLEDQMKTSYNAARFRVESTIENIDSVKSTVQDAVTGVKKVFDLKKHAEKNPIAFLGASVAAGALVGSLLENNRRKIAANEIRLESLQELEQRYSPLSPPTQVVYYPRRNSLFNRFTELFHDEIQMVKGMLIEGAMEKARKFAHQTFPEISEKVDKVVDSAESKFKI